MCCHSVCPVLFYSYDTPKSGIFTARFFISVRRSWIEACAKTIWQIVSEKLPSPLTQKWRCFKVPGRYRSGRLALLLARDRPKTPWLRTRVMGHPTAYANLVCVRMTDSSHWAPQKPQATVFLLRPQRTRGVGRPDRSGAAHLQVSDPCWRGNAECKCLYFSIPDGLIWKAVSLET